MKYMGIDPGQSGAIAYVSDGMLLDVVDMPTIDKEISPALLTQMVRMHVVAAVAVEKVWAAPTQGRTQGAQTSFKFGKAHGMVLGAAGALLVPLYEPTPQKWKKTFGLNADKERSRALATKLFPDRAELFKFKKNADRAEAALIALWCERQHQPSNYADGDGAPERVPGLRLRLRDSDRERLARHSLAR
jgi:Holliday junction resolvasome RuvABC endonuclease subunit